MLPDVVEAGVGDLAALPVNDHQPDVVPPDPTQLGRLSRPQLRRQGLRREIKHAPAP
jgi:hypothetical protein